MTDKRDNQVDLAEVGVWPDPDDDDLWLPDGIRICSHPLLPPKGFNLLRAAATGTIHFPEGVTATMPAHVQAFAMDAAEATGVSWISTYPGHDPDISHALDCFVALDDPAMGDAIADLAIERAGYYGLWYVIKRQHIFNVERADEGWRLMADRGSITANHYDHDHLSFYPAGQARPEEDFLATLTDEEKARLLGAVASIDDNTKNIGTILFAELGGGNWEEGAKRLARAVRMIEKLAGQG